MQREKDKILITLGIIYLIYWFLDFLHNAVLTNDYSWLLWYSSMGFLLTGIALIVQNAKLIYSLFCALFIIECAWIADFIYSLLSHNSLSGLTAYTLFPNFHFQDLLFTLYHAFIPVGLLIAVNRVKSIYRYGWIGAAIFAVMVVTSAYFLTVSQSQVDCVHSLHKCSTVFSFMYNIQLPFRLMIALFAMTLFIFIPTNYFVIYLKKIIK